MKQMSIDASSTLTGANHADDLGGLGSSSDGLDFRKVLGIDASLARLQGPDFKGKATTMLVIPQNPSNNLGQMVRSSSAVTPSSRPKCPASMCVSMRVWKECFGWRKRAPSRWPDGAAAQEDTLSRGPTDSAEGASPESTGSRDGGGTCLLSVASDCTHVTPSQAVSWTEWFVEVDQKLKLSLFHYHLARNDPMGRCCQLLDTWGRVPFKFLF